MSYRDWRAAFNRHLGSSDPALSAQRWNLENEKRIPKKTPAFKRSIGKNYADLTAGGVPSAEAVTQALEATNRRNERRSQQMAGWTSADRLANASCRCRNLSDRLEITKKAQALGFRQ